jgi:hypothetical protein
MFKAIIVLIFFLPLYSLAQNTQDMLPQNNVVKDTARQTDLIDLGKALFHIRPKKIREERDKKIYFSILPTTSGIPGGTGRVLITTTTAGVYLGPKKTTNLSSATFAPYWNFGSRFGLPLRSGIWLKNNTWYIQGDVRFLVYPQYTWGLGNSHDNDLRTLIDYRYIRFYQSALKKIKPYFFAGGGYNLDYHFNIVSTDPNLDLKQFTGYNYGTSKNSFSSGLTLNLLYDTRNNSINPLPGMYGNFVYRLNPTFLGSNDTWSSLYLDLRKYISLNRAKRNQQNTLAFWSYFWTALNSTTPYLDLPSTGWDPYNRSARGMDQNRYRGKTLLYLESEYRRDLTRNGLLGFVVFSHINTVSGSGSLFTSWHPGAGTGLRIKFNKGANTNVGLDYGVSKGYSVVSLSLGEAF